MMSGRCDITGGPPQSSTKAHLWSDPDRQLVGPGSPHLWPDPDRQLVGPGSPTDRTRVGGTGRREGDIAAGLEATFSGGEGHAWLRLR